MLHETNMGSTMKGHEGDTLLEMSRTVILKGVQAIGRIGLLLSLKRHIEGCSGPFEEASLGF